MIKELKTELKLLLAQDLEKATLKFKEIIDSESQLFDGFILLLGRYEDVKGEYFRDTVPLVEKNIEFAKIRGTLMKLINDLTANDIVNNEMDKEFILGENSVDAIEIVEYEEIGILEISEDAKRDQEEITALFLRLTGYIRVLNDKTTQGTAKLTRLQKSNRKPNQAISKKIIDEVGKEMMNYSEKARPEIILFRQLAESSIEKATRLIEWSFRDNLINDSEDLKKLKDTMLVLRDNAAEAKLSLLHYKTSIEKLPDLTTLLKKGKKNVINESDVLIREINNYLVRLTTFTDNIELTILEIGN